MKSIGFLRIVGVVGLFISQGVRTAAMITAQSNFTHLVSYEKEKDHQLVTWGIYR